ncbi:MAG TPA: creatininase family protein [Thermomicrobiales bacterium]|jgi:creatinine amidohydrolase|nr:creatininase family protein [Thermomicrobiales bacterium]
MTEVWWQTRRRDQIAAAPKSTVLLLPIGAVEQHGPHLPLDVDISGAIAVCERAAQALDDPPALVLPPVPWGLSPYWLPFAGTLSLRPETILALISDIGSSVARHGFGRLVIVNGHGGNAGIIGAAATMLADHGVRAAALSYWSLLGPAALRRLAPGDGGHIGHAGQTETSIQRYLRPELVAPEPPPDGADLRDFLAPPFGGAFYAPPDPPREAPLGVYGAAGAADAAIGRAVIERAAERLAEFVRRFAAEGAAAGGVG